MNHELSGLPTPTDIMDIGRDCAIVGQALNLWEMGLCTWAQAMALAVAYLHSQNQDLMGKVLSKIEQQALNSVVPQGLAILANSLKSDKNAGR